LDNEVGVIGLSRFLQFRFVFCLRTLSVWSCSFRKLHSHHHEIFYRQEQASLPLLRLKKTTLHGKKRASPSVGSVASRTKLPKATEDNPRENPPATNERFYEMAALPSFENNCYFRRWLLVGKRV
jgi:hypothetical protein